ncbi:MAG: hypothetical protein ACYC8W_06275 [Candidatus Tyrphobacter sp.]
MERFVLGTLAAVALAAAIATGSTVANAMPRPTPTPVALQYEEISRVEMPPATPVPPGTFQDDRAAIMAAVENTPAPHRGLFSGVMNGYQSAMNTMQSMRSGFLTRYTYYRNWVRTDDVAHQTATITKCDLHEYVTLDLAHRTYTIASTVPSPQPAPMPQSYGRPAIVNEAPGSEDLTVRASAQNLGPRTLDNVATHGSSASLSIVMSNATGSCTNGSSSMEIVEYVSGVGIPRAYCPLPRVSGAMQPAQQTIVHGGCRPRIHGNASGMSLLSGTSSRVTMYRRIVYGGEQTQGQRFGMVTEAGNVRWLYKPEAEALFSIPPGFTRTR